MFFYVATEIYPVQCSVGGHIVTEDIVGGDFVGGDVVVGDIIGGDFVGGDFVVCDVVEDIVGGNYDGGILSAGISSSRGYCRWGFCPFSNKALSFFFNTNDIVTWFGIYIHSRLINPNLSDTKI